MLDERGKLSYQMRPKLNRGFFVSSSVVVVEEASMMADRSFEELAMPLFDSLYNYARWLTREPAEAEDLVQETYLKGLRGFRSFAQGTNFKAWMFRILRNTFLTSRTGLRAVPSLSIDDEPAEAFQSAAGGGTPATHLSHRANPQTLQGALAALPL